MVERKISATSTLKDFVVNEEEEERLTEDGRHSIQTRREAGVILSEKSDVKPRTYSASSFQRQQSMNSMRRSSMVSIGSVGAGGLSFGHQSNPRGSIDSHFSLVAPESAIMPWILTTLAFLVMLTQLALLVLYWIGWETYFKSDLLCQAVWGGFLAFISGVAAIVALKTDTPNFPIFMLCHVTFAALAPMMCLLVIPAMTFRLIKTNGPNYEMEHGLAIFLSAIFNIFMVTVMALVSIIIAVSQTVKCCCKRKHQQKVRVFPI